MQILEDAYSFVIDKLKSVFLWVSFAKVYTSVFNQIHYFVKADLCLVLDRLCSSSVAGICLVVLLSCTIVIARPCCLHLRLDRLPSSPRLPPTCRSCSSANKSTEHARPRPPRCLADSTEPSLLERSPPSHEQVSACLLQDRMRKKIRLNSKFHFFLFSFHYSYVMPHIKRTSISWDNKGKGFIFVMCKILHFDCKVGKVRQSASREAPGAVLWKQCRGAWWERCGSLADRLKLLGSLFTPDCAAPNGGILPTEIEPKERKLRRVIEK